MDGIPQRAGDEAALLPSTSAPALQGGAPGSPSDLLTSWLTDLWTAVNDTSAQDVVAGAARAARAAGAAAAQPFAVFGDDLWPANVLFLLSVALTLYALIVLAPKN